MPFVNIQTVKGLLDEAQKQELLERITDLMVEIEGRGDSEFRKMVWVAIDEREPAH
jgi:4-oxalocrotonate tautomerase